MGDLAHEERVVEIVEDALGGERRGAHGSYVDMGGAVVAAEHDLERIIVFGEADVRSVVVCGEEAAAEALHRG